jgi:pyruvate dehydrogenase E2 component (dihydrolipoamide acetyltransferase)
MALIRAVTMPKWGIEMQEGLITAWSVEVGRTVAAGEPLLDVETEKIVNAVESPYAGQVRRILAAAGSAYPVGALLAVLAEPSVTDADVDAFIAAFRPAEAGFEPGEGAQLAAIPAAPAVPSSPSSSVPAPAATAVGSEAADGESRVSPIARRLAQKLGLDISGLKGTGPNGRISKEDVENYAAAQSVTAVAASVAPRVPTAPAPVPTAVAASTSTSAATPTAMTESAGVVRERLTPMRQTIARRLLESTQSIPHYRLERTVELSALLAERERRNAVSPARLSVNDFLLRAVAQCLVEHPLVNAHLVGDEVLRFKSADIAVAVATPTGLLTPVVRHADALSVSEIAARVRDLAARARAGRLARDEISGGTFTVSNLGMYGLDRFDAIINPPQVAILAVGAVRAAPVVINGSLAAGQVCTLTLSADHRVIDGAVGAAFLAGLAERLGAPGAL